MFFYTELSPLVIASNVSSLQFTNIAVNASSSMTFTVSAASGEKTETVTLSDDTNQFEFSPSSFSLGEGGSQVVTVTFKPTASATKTGKITANSSGGSSVQLNLTGSATNYIPIAYNSDIAPLVYADAEPGLKPPTGVGSFPTGSTGWMFINKTSTGVSSSMNYYFYDASLANTASVSQLDGAYAVVSMNANTAASSSWRPYLTVYTTRTRAVTPAEMSAGTFWFDSRISYSIYTGSVSANTKYLMYFGNDPGVYPELPRMKMGLMTNPLVTITSSQTPSEAIYSISIATSAGSSASTGSPAHSTNLNKQIVVTEAVGFHATKGTGSWNEILLQS